MSDVATQRSATQIAKDRKALIGALFTAGHRTTALALIRKKITVEEAAKRLKR